MLVKYLWNEKKICLIAYSSGLISVDFLKSRIHSLARLGKGLRSLKGE